MSARNDGGPAFPDPGRAQSAKQRETLTGTGITARDYFAAHAPISVQDALISAGFDTSSIGTLPREFRIEIMNLLAEMRMDYAEAMIAERAK